MRSASRCDFVTGGMELTLINVNLSYQYLTSVLSFFFFRNAVNNGCADGVAILAVEDVACPVRGAKPT